MGTVLGFTICGPVFKQVGEWFVPWVRTLLSNKLADGLDGTIPIYSTWIQPFFSDNMSGSDSGVWVVFLRRFQSSLSWMMGQFTPPKKIAGKHHGFPVDFMFFSTNPLKYGWIQIVGLITHFSVILRQSNSRRGQLPRFFAKRVKCSKMEDLSWSFQIIIYRRISINKMQMLMCLMVVFDVLISFDIDVWWPPALSQLPLV